MRERVTATNGFHNTSATALSVITDQGNLTLNAKQVRTLRKKLCPSDCRCFADFTTYAHGCRKLTSILNIDGTITLM